MIGGRSKGELRGRPQQLGEPGIDAGRGPLGAGVDGCHAVLGGHGVGGVFTVGADRRPPGGVDDQTRAREDFLHEPCARGRGRITGPLDAARGGQRGECGLGGPHPRANVGLATHRAVREGGEQAQARADPGARDAGGPGQAGHAQAQAPFFGVPALARARAGPDHTVEDVATDRGDRRAAPPTRAPSSSTSSASSTPRRVQGVTVRPGWFDQPITPDRHVTAPGEGGERAQGGLSGGAGRGGRLGREQVQGRAHAPEAYPTCTPGPARVRVRAWTAARRRFGSGARSSRGGRSSFRVATDGRAPAPNDAVVPDRGSLRGSDRGSLGASAGRRDRRRAPGYAGAARARPTGAAAQGDRGGSQLFEPTPPSSATRCPKAHCCSSRPRPA